MRPLLLLLSRVLPGAVPDLMRRQAKSARRRATHYQGYKEAKDLASLPLMRLCATPLAARAGARGRRPCSCYARLCMPRRWWVRGVAVAAASIDASSPVRGRVQRGGYYAPRKGEPACRAPRGWRRHRELPLHLCYY